MPRPDIVRRCFYPEPDCCWPRSFPLPGECVEPAPDANKQQWGAFGEDLAAALFAQDGWRIVARNWRCRFGELDLLIAREDMVAAVEVKLRRAVHTGFPSEAVTAAKVRRLRLLVGAWLAGHPDAFAHVRLDVLSILYPVHGPAIVEHIPGVGWL